MTTGTTRGPDDVVPRASETKGERPSQHGIADKLKRLANDVRDEMQKTLREEAVAGVLKPLDELIDATSELAELDRVHSELESQIIQPFELALARASRMTKAFGYIGVVAAIISVVGLSSSILVGRTQTRSLNKVNATIDKKLADASKRTESRLERLSAETEKRLADLVTQLEEVTAATAPLATEFNKLAVLFRRGSQTLPGPSTDGAALTAAANKFDLSGIMADLMEDPRKAFRDALVQRDISAMRVATQRAVDRNVGVFEEATMVSMLLALGDEGAVTLAERIWQQYRSTTMTAEIASVLLGGSVRFYVNHNRAKEFEPKAKEIAGFVTDEYPESTPSEKAFVINQLGILAHSYDLDAALAYTKRAIELNPDEPSYYHNVSIVLEENNRIGLAVKYAEDAIARGSEEKDPAHFRQAIDVYVRRLAEQKSTDTPSSEITGTEDRLRTLSRELRTIDDTAWRVAYAEYEVLRMLDPQ